MRSITLTVVLAMASVRVLDVTSFSVTQPLVVQEITMDITKPVDDKPFDGERIGTTVIIPVVMLSR